MPPVCRLGLASRGNTHLSAAGVRRAIERGVNYLNWCGHDDELSRTIAAMSKHKREKIVVAVQFNARTAVSAECELAKLLDALATPYIDVLTFYYVESMVEWNQIIAPGGSLGALVTARDAGRVRRIGLTTHQRPLAVHAASTGLLDLLMCRYNAAHRGAERDIFPVTGPANLPVVAFTCLRWGALMQPTPADPPGFVPPPAPQWYRFALARPEIAVALMAPDNEAELDANLELLNDWRPPAPNEMSDMLAHGDRVYAHAGEFP